MVILFRIIINFIFYIQAINITLTIVMSLATARCEIGHP